MGPAIEASNMAWECFQTSYSTAGKLYLKINSFKDIPSDEQT